MSRSIEECFVQFAPGGRPQAMAFHRGLLWLGSRDEKTLYEYEPESWTLRAETALPGIPYGLAWFDDAFRLVISIGADDDRYLYRFVPGEPFSEEGRVPCPDLSGSHLTSDGTSLYLVQQGNRRMLELNSDFSAKRTIPFPTCCAGAAFSRDGFHMISTDEDFNDLDFATFDIGTEGAQPEIIASMDFESRGLAFDGSWWWTCRRDSDLVTAFEG